MYFFTSFSKSLICSSVSFRHGIKSKFFPPLLMKLSLPCILISSKVSTQSDANPGHITKTFLIPLFGKLSSVLSVYGVNHS